MSDDESANHAGEKDTMLSHLLKQLRPFQREAYDFCCEGIVPTRKCSNVISHDGSNIDRHDESKSSKKIVYQNDLLGKGRILLADEMGLGKSITSLAIMAHYRTNDWPLLILCPASLRYTWPGEIEKFIPSLPPSSIYVVSGFDDADFYENKSKRSKIQIVIATYSLLQTRSAAAKTLAQFNFQSIIVDESHNLKQRNSQRTKLALPILEQAKRLVLLSGTPALARPVELWTQISTIAPGLFENNYTQFTKKYCNARRGRFGWDVNGLSNPGELHERLRQIMVRRLKADVLHELPPKQRTIIEIKIPKGVKRREIESLMRDLVETRQSIHDMVGEAADAANFEARRLLMQAYQVSGAAKSEGVCDYLLESLRGSGSQKVLIFGHHKAVLDALEVAVSKEFKGTGHIRIDGTVNSQERAARVRKFQKSSRIRVAILSITAAGVGLTLTAATTVMFAELHWTPGVLAQAEDRCHRIGQRNAVNVFYLICQDPMLSIDSQLWRMLGRKTGTLGRVVDGEKNASMNARVAKEGDLPKPGGRSVQDELQTFFAETSPSAASSLNKQAPIKGTILSFFQKQSKAAAANPPRTKSSPCIDTEDGQGSSISSSKNPSFAAKKVQSRVEWDCESCTYRNSRFRPHSAYLACEMCRTQYFEEMESSPMVTPPSICNEASLINGKFSSIEKKASQDDPIVLDDDDDGVDERSNIPSKKRWEPKRLQTTVNKEKQEEFIILDDGDDNDNIQDSMWCKRPTRAASPASVVLDVESDERESDKSVREVNNSLTFSVSKNSGRITLHYAGSNESSLTNFEIDQVVSDTTADNMLEAKIHRKSSSKASGEIQIEFNVPAIQGVIANIDLSQLRDGSTTDKLLLEITHFITAYQNLREVEKKAVRDSGVAYSPYELRQAALQFMTSIGTKYISTERYSGGAKERARENLKNGTADPKDMATLEGNLCAWCGGNFPLTSQLAGVESTYCSRDCAQQGRLKRGGIYASTRIREQLFALESGVCRNCKIDAHALYTRIIALHPAERLNALMNACWKLPKTPRALERLLQNPKEGDFWEADHIRAVAEGGGSCDLDNLQTLCVPCHLEETEKLKGRLKLTGSKQSGNDNKHQTDIRSMFKPVSLSFSKKFKRQKV